MASKKSLQELSLSESNLIATTSRVSLLRRSIHARARTSISHICTVDLSCPDPSSGLEIDEDDQNDALRIFQHWPLMNMCRVSPLHNLHYDNIKLKQYALKVKQFLAGSVKYGSIAKYRAEIKTVENLKIRATHPDALMVSVWGGKAEDEVESRLLYEGVLFSWGCFAADNEPNVTNLPLLFDHGNSKVVAGVREILKKLFDCVITQLVFTQSEMLLFSALISSFTPSQGAKPVTFVYAVPHTSNPTKIEISMEADDIHNLWKSYFVDNPNPIYNEDSSHQLYKRFQEHITTYHGVNVSFFELINLNYPNIILRSKGVMKLKEIKVTRMVLKILCEMSVILRGSTPKLAFEYD